MDEDNASYFGSVDAIRPRLPREVAQQQDPWVRLHHARTITNFCKTIDFDISDVPQDRLDYSLSSTYNHFTDFSASSQDAAAQNRNHTCYGRLYTKVEPDRIPTPTRPHPCHLLYVSTYPKKMHLSQAKLAIGLRNCATLAASPRLLRGYRLWRASLVIFTLCALIISLIYTLH